MATNVVASWFPAEAPNATPGYKYVNFVLFKLEWGAWGPWGECDSKCRRYRTRECFPDGSKCSGDNKEMDMQWICGGDICPGMYCLPQTQLQLKLQLMLN